MADPQSVAELFNWLLEKAAEQLWGALVLFVIGKLLLSWRRFPFARLVRRFGSIIYRFRPATLVRWGRACKKWRLKRLRARRFDLAWINRETGRGHICIALMVLWFGVWLFAIGLKESLKYTADTGGLTSGQILIGVLPTYVFEIGWIWFSSSSGRVIKHRQKIRVWRFGHSPR